MSQTTSALAGHALMEAGTPRAAVEKACDWLAKEQILNLKGDWADWRPNRGRLRCDRFR